MSLTRRPRDFPPCLTRPCRASPPPTMSELHEQRQRPTHAARIGGEGQQPGAAFIDAVRAQSIHGSAAAAAEAAGERLFNGDLLQEANGSKYQQQKLGDVPSSQPHHLNVSDSTRTRTLN
uniref:Uncharacterized protein n=1 Tax=Oryza rufipogon TaxID=4529 RepID=A0A0E0QHD4_ORYRU